MRGVSILTRAFARVQRGGSGGHWGALRCFNPHSSFRPSATRFTLAQSRPARFQSSLELSPECNAFIKGLAVQPQEFQSSLELSPECNPLHPAGVQGVSRGFNPHSSFRPSATANACQISHFSYCFNPHSSFRPSATGSGGSSRYHVQLFQSSLELSPECNVIPREEYIDLTLVSILTRAFARVQPPPLSLKFTLTQSFNPHSSFRPSATPAKVQVGQ